ncbi:hypothetical protein D3C80_2168490 [compost metagenome]
MAATGRAVCLLRRLYTDLLVFIAPHVKAQQLVPQLPLPPSQQFERFSSSVGRN